MTVERRYESDEMAVKKPQTTKASRISKGAPPGNPPGGSKEVRPSPSSRRPFINDRALLDAIGHLVRLAVEHQLVREQEANAASLGDDHQHALALYRNAKAHHALHIAVDALLVDRLNREQRARGVRAALFVAEACDRLDRLDAELKVETEAVARERQRARALDELVQLAELRAFINATKTSARALAKQLVGIAHDRRQEVRQLVGKAAGINPSTLANVESVADGKPRPALRLATPGDVPAAFYDEVTDVPTLVRTALRGVGTVIDDTVRDDIITSLELKLLRSKT